MSRKTAIKLVTTRFPPGTLINDRYEVVRLIAKGGMGCVFLGEQHPLGRRVALKILLPQTHDPAFKQRFFLEASVSSKLNHRNIVTVHDFGETPTGEAYMVMEFLDGLPLSRLVAKQGPLSLERSLSIATQVSRAVRAAHRAGVVHRDLKPGNVMVVPDEEDATEDRVRVLDFGLVKVFEANSDEDSDDPELTRAGMMLGSPRYMSPEQITCGTIDPRTDVYALGTILFEMLTGRSPYEGADASQIMQAHLLDPVPSALELAPAGTLPPLIDEIIGRCLAKRPEHRYASMDDVLGVLEQVTLSPSAPSELEEVPDEASPSPEPSTPLPPSSDPAPPRKRKTNWMGIGLALIALVAGGSAFRIYAPGGKPPVKVILTSTPGGAEVSYRGRELGVTPLRVALPRTPDPLEEETFSFSAKGRRPVDLIGRLDQDELRLHAHLPPSPPARTPPK